MTKSDIDERTKTLKRKRFYNMALNELLPLVVTAGAAFSSLHYVKTHYNPGEAPKTVQVWEKEKMALSYLEKIEEKSDLLATTEQELRSHVNNPSEEVKAYISASDRYREMMNKTSNLSIASIVLGAAWVFGVGFTREKEIEDELDHREYMFT